MPPADAPSPSGPTAPHWHLVCRVIDNFGDVGVLWRLARQLRDEWGYRISFFIDDVGALLKLAPDGGQPMSALLAAGAPICEPSPSRSPSRHPTPSHATPPVQVFALDESSPIGTGADMVVLGFQVRLPDAARRAWLAAPQARRPQLVQLEYLSAESWVEDCHALPCLSPDGLRETFFHPGFGPRTGGLLLERGLLTERDRFMADPANRTRWLASLGIRIEAHEILVSLLCYASAPLEALLRSWLAHPQLTGGRCLHLLAPGADTQTHLADLKWVESLSQPDTPMDAHSATPSGAAAPASASRPRVRLSRLPFLPQPEFDHLLWSCDVNLVRGEDSWIRALWAGRPWLWQAYPQSEDAHLDKLSAFLARMQDDLSRHEAATGLSSADRQTPPDITTFTPATPSRLTRWQQAMCAWNRAPNHDTAQIVSWLADLPAAAGLARRLGTTVAAHSGDLASRLVAFCQSRRAESSA
ncbi:MAG: elongation factor P maturation arginine rhamnosyltransferase EarP [Lautropia sp.]|nr:elongation factor P maturation arginine rhamnosyltransferase EarP [Lautropia sp.]